jgi:hypothetical protein
MRGGASSKASLRKQLEIKRAVLRGQLIRPRLYSTSNQGRLSDSNSWSHRDHGLPWASNKLVKVSQKLASKNDRTSFRVKLKVLQPIEEGMVAKQESAFCGVRRQRVSSKNATRHEDNPPN